jgi:hypothetical protein
MKPRVMLSGIGPLHGAPDQPTKHSSNCRSRKGLPAFGDKEVVGSNALIADMGIVLQGSHGAAMQRDQPGLFELALVDRDDAPIPIDISLAQT